MIHGYAAMEPEGDLEQWEYDPGDLDKDEIAISIDYCGICHSDVHLVDDDWGVSSYPFIPGHEIVGTVSSTGADADRFDQEDRVAVGWQAGSCGMCEWCDVGKENLCPKQQPTAIGRNGGFADAINVAERFAFRVPDDLDGERTAPLLCGGITMYTPLRQVDSSDRVGIVGMGGLGHFGVQFADAKGCHVTVFSTSPGKGSDAEELGADSFVHARDTSAIADEALDFIISTVPAELDWNAYVDALRPEGRLCNVGAVPGDISVDARKLLAGKKGVIGSNTGGRKEIEEMLAFVARHDIGAVVESYDITDVNEAFDRVRSGDARYRVVLSI